MMYALMAAMAASVRCMVPGQLISMVHCADRVKLPCIMQVGMSGGDLEGGRNNGRNADVQALKKLFYSGTEATVDVERAAARQNGLLLDLPIARFRSVLLPHQQAGFNIFQPQLVHLFESLMATPEPWFYMHVLLPGGVDNLGNPDYALPGLGVDGAPGDKATLQGTLMQIVATKRMPDARIALISQGLHRAVVVRGTRALPYARGDVQILPDAEQLLAATLRATSLAASSLLYASSLRLAWEEECAWRAYEFGRVDMEAIVDLPPFAGFDPSALEGCSASAASAAVTERTPPAPTASSGVATAVPGETDARHGSEVVEFAVTGATEAARAMSEAETSAYEAETAELLGALEVQIWLELDAFLRGVAQRSADGGLPAPTAQLLSLLPPAPAAGWPDEFRLAEVALSLEERVEAQRAIALFNPAMGEPEPFVPVCHERLPVRRRVQRLSFVLLASICREDEVLLRGLEVTSTADRLRLALRQLRALRESL